MSLSDFTAGPLSTHGLLYRIFASELGLLSVASAAVQFEALAAACPALKQVALSGVGSTVPLTIVMLDYSEVEIAIPGKDEAHLFLELYKGLELFTGGTAFADEYSQSVTLAQLVYPLTARAIEAQPDLASAVIRQLTEHMEKYDSAVCLRVETDLRERFRFSTGFLNQLGM